MQQQSSPHQSFDKQRRPPFPVREPAASCRLSLRLPAALCRAELPLFEVVEQLFVAEAFADPEAHAGERAALLRARQSCNSDVSTKALLGPCPEGEAANEVFSAALKGEAVKAAAASREGTSVQGGGAFLRLLTTLLPHEDSRNASVRWLDEYAALLLPPPTQVESAAADALPPLNFEFLWNLLRETGRRLQTGCVRGEEGPAPRSDEPLGMRAFGKAASPCEWRAGPRGVCTVHSRTRSPGDAPP